MYLSISRQVEYSSKVLDMTISKPLAYVNIGIVGKNVGTVTNTDGVFQLKITSEYHVDTEDLYGRICAF